MKKRIIALCLLVICMLGLVCMAGCQQSEEAPAPNKFTMYVGLNDVSGTQKLDIPTAQTAVRSIFLDNGLGYTEFVAKGAYLEDGTPIENDTLVYEFMFVEKDQVLAIADEVKSTLNLATILIEEEYVEYYFTEGSVGGQ